MIEIGEKPILSHIMKIYSCHGFNDFFICLGYKGYVIKEYIANCFLHESDVTLVSETGTNGLSMWYCPPMISIAVNWQR